MNSITVKAMRELEDKALAAHLSEEELLREAGTALGFALGSQYSGFRLAVAFCGKGLNGADAVIALEILRDCFGFSVGVVNACYLNEMNDLAAKALESSGIAKWEESDFSELRGQRLLVLDGLLGIGGKGALTDSLKKYTRQINQLRNEHGAEVVAIDSPTGVNADSGEPTEDAVIAGRTLMMAVPKVGLLSSHAVDFCGQLGVVPMRSLFPERNSKPQLICPQGCEFGKNPRAQNHHKGAAGRVAVIAGSVNFSGAAIISSMGAIRAGGGLVTLVVDSQTAEAVRHRLPAEVMLAVHEKASDFSAVDFDALVIGPGLGEMPESRAEELVQIIRDTEAAIVLDADGLRLVYEHGMELSERFLLTPHPGEFRKLTSFADEGNREATAQRYADENGCVLLLKGGRTLVAQKSERLRINSTGTPAMSNGGQGDLLSGVCGAFAAGGMNLRDAASLGAWVCGHAAELAEEEIGDVTPATSVAGKAGLSLRNWRLGAR